LDGKKALANDGNTNKALAHDGMKALANDCSDSGSEEKKTTRGWVAQEIV
jgi:hypothetical protein